MWLGRNFHKHCNIVTTEPHLNQENAWSKEYITFCQTVDLIIFLKGFKKKTTHMLTVYTSDGEEYPV